MKERISIKGIQNTEIFRFILVGLIATFIHYSIYLIINIIVVAWLAYSIGYFISFIFNFYLSSVFTFKSKASIKKGIGFSVSHAINYGLHIVLFSFFRNMSIPENYAPIFVYMIAIPVNFILVRFVFKVNKIQRKLIINT